MLASASVFLDFNLPKATTWTYFSFLLAVALFFKFSRLPCMRNWDVVLLFLLAPGLLLIHGSRPGQVAFERQTALQIASLVGWSEPTQGCLGAVAAMGAADLDFSQASSLWVGYLWLLLGSAYFFIRCFIDLALVQRPALEPNLNFGGLAWLAGALFVCLMAVALRQPNHGNGSDQTVLPRSANGQEGLSPIAPVGRESTIVLMARDWFAAYPWMTRSFAGLCHLAVIFGLVLVGQRHFHDARAGMAAATFYLMLPYTGLYVSQVHHVWPMALIVWALVVFRFPTLAGILLGVAAGTSYFPVLILPLWQSFYWKRGWGRFLAAFFLAGVLCLGVPALFLGLEGQLDNTLREVLEQDAWQPWKVPTTEGFWTGVHWAYRIPVFLAYLAFVLATAFWPAPKNLAQVIALSAAVIIGIQFWYADQGGVYVLWYLPLLMLLVFRPNLADRRPEPIQPELDWLTRLGDTCRRGWRWLFRFLVRTPPREEKVSG